MDSIPKGLPCDFLLESGVHLRMSHLSGSGCWSLSELQRSTYLHKKVIQTEIKSRVIADLNSAFYLHVYAFRHSIHVRIRVRTPQVSFFLAWNRVPCLFTVCFHQTS